MSVLFVRPGGLRTCRASRFYAPYNVLGKEVKSVRKLRVLFLSLTWGEAFGPEPLHQVAGHVPRGVAPPAAIAPGAPVGEREHAFHHR